eukprot:CAMPEP_0194485836 /NCGR_PEP_ID=MMETSP0253-20130528/6697_1 /TAXON_ID=2966 /ORGANISM="Noctiluca scintillans" /LENGTH=831 /DNA_ID=CAMNT_0039325857 /DNA_START=145 /DNA_END=2641 /DNA_ORIENTATION=+
MRWRLERVDSDRTALEEALHQSQATLLAEARRAGAAEYLLRERTATLEAVARSSSRRASSREAARRRRAVRLRSNSSSSTSVGSEDTQSENKDNNLDRSKLLNKLSEKERETAELRNKDATLRATVASSAKEAEELRVELVQHQSNQTDLRLELESALSERDNLVENAATQHAAFQFEVSSMKSRAEGLLDELSKVRDVLESRTSEVSRLQQEKSKLENAQNDLDQAQVLLDAKIDEANRIAQDKRALEVAFSSYKESLGSGDSQQLAKIADLQVTVDRLSRQMDLQEQELGTQQGNSSELMKQNRNLTEQLRCAENQRTELHNTLQELRGNIRVYCRVRPVQEGSDCSLDLSEQDKMTLSTNFESHAFSFDKVFGPDTEQADIFAEVEGLVQSALDGYKVCIFAYGQTGSGKTFTMQGTDAQGCAGLIPRSLLTIFKAAEEMRSRGWEWSVHVSFMEVYNETLRDLLRGTEGPPAEAHVIAHQEEWGITVTGMTRILVESVEQIEVLTARAAKQRSVAATDMNATSSRSHSVFTLYLKGTSATLNKEIHGALSLVDLAGSERLDRSGATGDRLTETRNINRSLSSLADVFRAKAMGQKHVPFRNSKLTHLMEPCLSGQGKTLMLVNVQPEQESAPETLCSLRFAKQVSQCTTGGKAKRTVKTLTTVAKIPVNDTKPKLPAQPMAVVVAVEPRREKERSVTPRGRTLTNRNACREKARQQSSQPATSSSQPTIRVSAHSSHCHAKTRGPRTPPSVGHPQPQALVSAHDLCDHQRVGAWSSHQPSLEKQSSHCVNYGGQTCPEGTTAALAQRSTNSAVQLCHQAGAETTSFS